MSIRQLRSINISSNTPNEVLLFLVETIGKKISKDDFFDKRETIIEFLQNYHQDINLNNLAQISNYVSPIKNKWEKNLLLQEFKRISSFFSSSFDETTFFSSPIKEELFGDITPKFKVKYDISMLYKICLQMNIDLTEEDNFETMKNKYYSSFYKNLNRGQIFNNIISSICKCETDTLINIMIQIDKKNNNYIEKNTGKYDINHLLSRGALSDEESVIFSVKLYGIDLSESENPSLESKFLNKCKIENIEYTPLNVNSEFYNRWKKNKNYYDITKWWKKKYDQFYTTKMKENISKYECCPYEEIAERYTTFNFYDLGDTIGYGTEDNIKKISEIELVDLFQKNNYFSHPENDELINYDVILKLEKICGDNNYISLQYELDRIKKLVVDNTPQVKKYLEDYTQKMEIYDEFFKGIRLLVYNFRGWEKEGDSVPYKSKNCKDYNEKLVDENFKRVNNNLNIINDIIKNLWIIKYKNKSYKYTKESLIKLLDLSNLKENIDYTTILIQSCNYYYKLSKGKDLIEIDKLEYIESS